MPKYLGFLEKAIESHGKDGFAVSSSVWSFCFRFFGFLALYMSRLLIILGVFWLGETFYNIKASDWLILFARITAAFIEGQIATFSIVLD